MFVFDRYIQDTTVILKAGMMEGCHTVSLDVAT